MRIHCEGTGRGQTALEYLLIIAGILLVVVTVILFVTGAVIQAPQNQITNVSNWLAPVK
jgi:uncharacterized protein (UPF0333 family)